MIKISGPKIAFHGGLCCGIKIIYGLGYNPESMCCSRERDKHRTEKAQNTDQYGSDVSSSFDVFNRDAPEENVLDRIKRFVEFLDQFRPKGITEIVLADNLHDEYNQYVSFGPHIEKLGFKLVTSAKNSNSGNTVYVYHRISDCPSIEIEEDESSFWCDC